ncbi:MAG: hypothetical protein JNL66_03765 [Alphaproteobacteria bacterium]|nr:hypothetical protein [Alphaproteobacteria bacterium]
MNRILAMAVAALPLLAAAGCGTPLQLNPGASGGPLPADYQAIADGWLNETLPQPEGRRVVYTTQPTQYEWTFADSQRVWLVCGTVAQRAANGSYGAAEPFYVMIQNGAAVDGDVVRPGQRQNLPRPCQG